MRSVVVFGGTSEGREACQWLARRALSHVTYVTATAYGAELVDGLPHVTTLVGPLEDARKRALVERADVVVDATHPFATHITESTGTLCSELGRPYLRVVREEDEEGGWVSVDGIGEAADHVRGLSGNVLLTTGTSGLATFCERLGDASRIFCRVLPREASLAAARAAGIAADHVIALQGPCSERLNRALIAEYAISCLVTKQSGERGGYPEKARAAAAEGIELVVIERPKHEVGHTLEECLSILEVTYGL